MHRTWNLRALLAALTLVMCHCITPQALLSALVGRVQRGGSAPTLDELRAVLDVGCSRDEVHARFATVGELATAHVEALLARIPS